jgi:hypothetical protein
MNAVVAGVCFFKGYCDVAKLKIIQKLFSQIWLRTWNESKNCFKKISCSILGYMFGTYHKTLGIWKFFLFFEIWRIWAMFFLPEKSILCIARNHIFQIGINWRNFVQ